VSIPHFLGSRSLDKLPLNGGAQNVGVPRRVAMHRVTCRICTYPDGYVRHPVQPTLAEWTVDKPVLTDKDQFPTDEVVFSHIGKSKLHWEELFNYTRSNYADFSQQWRYYNDGKSWLLKVVKKSKTIFWVSVMNGSFKTTFYFGDKAEESILESNISDDLKDSFKNGKRYGKIRGITTEVKAEADLDDVRELIRLKLSQK
jgi:hypothetical protein